MTAVRVYIYVSQPETVFTALVNMASVSYPLTSITFDGVTSGTYTDIEPGMTLLLGSTAGASDLGIQRVRAAATTTAIPVGRSSQGVRVGELNVVNNAYITVLDERRVWSKIPRITSTGTQYKDEITFSAASAQPPVANAGADAADEIDPSTGVITVAFDATDSYAVANGATLSTYAWDFADGTPSSSSNATETGVTFPAGERYVKLTVTDSNGNSHSAYRWVVAVDPEGTPNWIPAEISTSEHGRDGSTFEFVVRGGNLARTTYPEGTRVIAVYEEDLDGGRTTLFSGWLAEEVNTATAGATGLKRQVTFRCQDIAARLRTLPVFSQRINRDNSADNWYDMAYANIDRYLHYLLHWHSTALEVADFIPSNTGNTYAIPSLQTDAGNFFDQVDRLAQAIAHKLTCNMAGQLFVKGDPIIQPTSSQASTYSLPVQRTSTVSASLDASDYGGVTFSSAIPPRQHWLWGEAVTASTSTKRQTAVFCYAPGASPGQGEGSVTQGEQLVISQTELNIREGHRYAARLNPQQSNHSLALTEPHFDIDPADMEWVQVTLPASVTPQRGVVYSSERFLPISITRRFDGQRSKVSTTLELEREVVGTEAQTYVPPKEEQQGFPAYEVPTIQFPTPILPTIPPAVPGGTGTLALFTGLEGGIDGQLIITRDFQSDSPTYTRTLLVNLGMVGVFKSFVVDPFSPLYLGTGTQVNGWIADTQRIYRITDIFGSVALTQQHLFATAVGTNLSNNRFLQASRGTQNWVMCISQDPGTAGLGTNIAYTTDGTSWSESTITTFSTNESFNNEATLVLNERVAGTALAGGYSAANVGALYKTTDYGASWSVQGSPTDFGIVSGGWLHVPYGDTSFSKLYYGANASTTNREFRLSGVPGNRVTDFAPRGRRCIHSCDTNANAVAAILTSQASSSVRNLYTSIDGVNFTLKQSSTGYGSLSVGSNNPSYLILWGVAIIAVSNDFGATISDRTGNLGSLTNAQIENICGG